MSSTDTIGGRSIGFFARKGKLSAVIIINTKCKTEEMMMLLFTLFTSLYMAQI